MGGKAVGRFGGTAGSEVGGVSTTDIPPYRPTALPPFSIIGKPLPKIDAAAKCLGRTLFADDIVLPRMLAAKILRSPHPHARIVSIDTSRARALEGVKAVITGKDMPNAFGILPVSQDEHALEGDHVRFIGDPVAAVAANGCAQRIQSTGNDEARISIEFFCNGSRVSSAENTHDLDADHQVPSRRTVNLGNRFDGSDLGNRMCLCTVETFRNRNSIQSS